MGDIADPTLAPPSQWVKRWLSAVRRGGHVVDVACGRGRHTRLALSAGHLVTAIDRDVSAHDCAGAEGLTLMAADLETAAGWPLTGQQFDSVIVTNYLHRPILPDIVGVVADDGVLIYETFAVGQELIGRPRRAEYLLRPGELLEAVHDRLVVLAFEHTRLGNPERFVQRITAVGPRHRWLEAPSDRPSF